MSTGSDAVVRQSPDDALGMVMLRRRRRQEPELDIAPMIDVTFLLLIFFLVATIPDARAQVDLPPARYGTAVSARNALVITLGDRGQQAADLFLADGKSGEPLPPGEDQQTATIVEAVEQARQSGTNNVVIKSDKGIDYHEVKRVAAAVGQVEGMALFFAVLEVE